MSPKYVGMAMAGLILVGQGCGASSEPSAKTTTPPAENNQAAVVPNLSKFTVEITAKGFSPSELKVPANSEVTFINKDSSPRWPASAVHPTHKVCPGFDAKKGLSKDESYAFVFKDKKECPFHDHLNPSLRGKIIVE